MELKAAYLEDWMDSKLYNENNSILTIDNYIAIESLPGELQRNFSLIRELDASSQRTVYSKYSANTGIHPLLQTQN
jgi:hypothetical protein